RNTQSPTAMDTLGSTAALERQRLKDSAWKTKGPSPACPNVACDEATGQVAAPVPPMALTHPPLGRSNSRGPGRRALGAAALNRVRPVRYVIPRARGRAAGGRGWDVTCGGRGSALRNSLWL